MSLVTSLHPPLGGSRADTLRPLTTIRNTILQPESASSTPSNTLARLLSTHHLARIQQPWQAFRNSATPAASTSSSARTVTIPGTAATFEVDAELAKLASQLASRTGCSIDDACALCKSYELYSLDDDRRVADDGRLARILAWWSEETVAVAEIAVNVLVLGAGLGEQDWGDMAAGVREILMEDPEKWIEGLFRAFSALAQKPLEGSQRSDYPLFWYIPDLRLSSCRKDKLTVTGQNTTCRCRRHF